MTKTQQTRDRLLPVAQTGAFVAGRVSASWRTLPNALICGAQRCGTTSMYQALRQHPAALRPVARKGVHYFDDPAYLRGAGWYRAHFPLTRTVRRVGAATGSTPVVFESSPYYLFHPAAAQRIAADLPGVRVLILLRDPVERAYSAHAHEHARGFDPEPFERALDLEEARLRGEAAKLVADAGYSSHAHRHQGYVSRGHYIDQVLRMVDAVGRDRVHVIDAEDFFTDPAPVWHDVSRFFGLPAMQPVFERHNARPRSALPDSVRVKLREGYADSDARLEQWWGRTPSWRR